VIIVFEETLSYPLIAHANVLVLLESSSTGVLLRLFRNSRFTGNNDLS
jgi:hypothetical protein